MHSGIAEWLETAMRHHKAGQLDTARTLYREILAREPRHPSALHLLGVLALQSGRPERALELIRQAIAANPNCAEFHANLGTALNSLDRLEEAEQAHRRALQLNPAFADAYNNLGLVYIRRNQHELAEPALREAVRLNPSCAPAWNNLGVCLKEQAYLREAQAALREALRLQPDYADAAHNLGLLLQKLGDRDAARTALRRALDLQPEQPSILAHWLSHNRYDRLDHPDIAHARSVLTHVADPRSLHYALGRIHDQHADYPRAFEHFTAAKHRSRDATRYERAAHEDLQARLVRLFTPDFIRERCGFGCDTRQPVFIVGTSRSGKTLAERLLAAHPHARGAGELPALLNALRGRGTVYPEGIAAFSAADCQALTTDYLACLRRAGGADPLRLSNTLPVHVGYLGLIALLFPRASIIYCRRDPLDAGLAIYSKDYGKGVLHADDPADIAHYLLHYEHLMAHWRAVLPMPVLELRYEEMAQNPTDAARRIHAHVGLPPHAGALPELHDRWIGHSRHYPALCGDLRKALRSLM